MLLRIKYCLCFVHVFSWRSFVRETVKFHTPLKQSLYREYFLSLDRVLQSGWVALQHWSLALLLTDCTFLLTFNCYITVCVICSLNSFIINNQLFTQVWEM